MLLIFISVLYISIVDSVPSKCELALNSSDCGLRPAMVYTYHSPNAVCHPAVWRGCPTSNKFEYEHDCLISCTGHVVSNYFLGVKVTDPMPKSGAGVASKVHGLKIKPPRCDVPLNITRCTNKMKQVFTFNNEIEACVAAVWFGCPSENIFTDVSSCQYNCPNTWNKELDRMEKYLAKEKCAIPLNTSRCTRNLKSVYTFNIDKRGCVKALWFGCPSNNMYPDISSCRKSCHEIWDEELELVDTYEETEATDFPKELTKTTDPPQKENNPVNIEMCDVPLNTSRCKKQLKQVYTFNIVKQACVKASWLGCPSKNIFNNISSCQKNCHKERNIMGKFLATEICNLPLNTSSRCSDQLKHVYTFSVEEQDCVKASWFGCPSINIFTDIFSCLKTCLNKSDDGLKHMVTFHKKEFSDVAKLNKNVYVTTEGNKLARPKGCDVLLNTNRCTKHMKQVYTYDNEKGACIRALWFGCPSENLFDDISSCHRHCHEKVDKVTTIAIPKIRPGKNIDYNDKAYFIYKLKEANKGLGELIHDSDIMLLAQDKYNVL